MSNPVHVSVSFLKRAGKIGIYGGPDSFLLRLADLDQRNQVRIYSTLLVLTNCFVYTFAFSKPFQQFSPMSQKL
jgi:hypothetical protein